MAYAALVSLSQTLGQILDSDPYFFPCDKEKVASFREIIATLIAFLDNCAPICTQMVNDLISQIRDTAYEAEDVFESLLATHFLQMYGSDSYEKFKVFPQSLKKVMEDMESIAKEVKKIHHDGNGIHERRILTIASSSRPSLRGNNTKMVALDNELEMKLMEQLMGGHSKIDVVPIVGMGGIGKTTLARILCDSKPIMETFDVCGWATISQTHNVQKIALDILKDIREPFDGSNSSEQYLYQCLYGRKYLIVLDDIWDTQACDDLKRLFPENNNGSRVILTTRHSKVATYANTSGICHEMEFLNKDTSWSLLCQEIFPQRNCPSELVEIGKEIAIQCHGLPLTISAIGGHLKKEKQTKEYWKHVSKNITSVLNNSNDPSLEILTLSYNYLPHYLKACFLYFASFQEDDSINVFTLLKLWVAEGFVQPSISSSMEEVAEEYLRDVIERNLVLVYKYDTLGKPKICGIHDLLRDVCIKEAKKEKFLFFLNKDALFDHIEIDSQRRWILSPNSIHDDDECLIGSIVSRIGSCSAARSFIRHRDDIFPQTITRGSGLLKVMNIWMKAIPFPIEIFELVNLKYLLLGFVSEIPSSISRLRNLQTLIAVCDQYLPSEIWEMPQLRHLIVLGFRLPDIRYFHGKRTNACVLKSLQTIVGIIDLRCTQDVYTRIPNLKQLSIYYTMSFHSSNNLVYLCNLESLHCIFEDEPSDNILPNFFFPSSLKKLVLSGCRISWEHLTIIGILPNLQVLKLKNKAMVGNLWETNDGEFKHLMSLTIRDSDLVEWNTEKEHFPRLVYLQLKFCNALEAIPSEIAEIPTLERIVLLRCSLAAVSSAKEMLGEVSEVKLIIDNDEKV